MPQPKYKIYIWAVVVAAVIFVLYGWLNDIFSGEEGRVRKFIRQGKKVVEAKDILAASVMISESYQDKYSNDRASLLYGAKEFFQYYKSILIHIEKIEIKLDDSKDKASAEIQAIIIGQSAVKGTEKILEGGRDRFRVKLIKEDKKWKLLELEFFQPLKIMGFDIA